MKNKIKILGAGLLGLFLTFVMPAAVKAADLNQLQVSELARAQSSKQVTASASPMITLYYVGTATESVVTITTTAITAFAPAGAADTGDFGVNVSSYIFNSTTSHRTIGGLCDAIDALADYKCVMQGAKRSDDPKFLRDQTATGGSSVTNLKSAGGYTIYADHASSGTTSAQTYFLRLGIQPTTSLSRVRMKYCTILSSGTGNISFYGKLKEFEGSDDGITRNDSTLVYVRNPADSTEVSYPAAYPTGAWMTFAKGEHVVVSAGELSNSVQGSTNYLDCQYDQVGP